MNSHFKTKTEKRRLDVFASNPNLMLIPKSTINTMNVETETMGATENILNANNDHNLSNDILEIEENNAPDNTDEMNNNNIELVTLSNIIIELFSNTDTTAEDNENNR